MRRGLLQAAKRKRPALHYHGSKYRFFSGKPSNMVALSVGEIPVAALEIAAKREHYKANPIDMCRVLPSLIEEIYKAHGAEFHTNHVTATVGHGLLPNLMQLVAQEKLSRQLYVEKPYTYSSTASEELMQIVHARGLRIHRVPPNTERLFIGPGYAAESVERRADELVNALRGLSPNEKRVYLMDGIEPYACGLLGVSPKKSTVHIGWTNGVVAHPRMRLLEHLLINAANAKVKKVFESAALAPVIVSKTQQWLKRHATGISLDNHNIGIIGVGAVGSALIDELLMLYPDATIYAYDKNSAQLDHPNIHVCSSEAEVAARTSITFCCAPYTDFSRDSDFMLAIEDAKSPKVLIGCGSNDNNLKQMGEQLDKQLQERDEKYPVDAEDYINKCWFMRNPRNVPIYLPAAGMPINFDGGSTSIHPLLMAPVHVMMAECVRLAHNVLEKQPELLGGRSIAKVPAELQLLVFRLYQLFAPELFANPKLAPYLTMDRDTLLEKFNDESAGNDILKYDSPPFANSEQEVRRIKYA